MEWNAALADSVGLVADRIGFLKNELRLYLRPILQVGPRYVLQLEDVAAFTNTLPCGVTVRISDRPTAGSFGWWLAPDDPHRSVMVTIPGTAESMSGFLLVLARRVVYRIADDGEANNWPG